MFPSNMALSSHSSFFIILPNTQDFDTYRNKGSFVQTGLNLCCSHSQSMDVVKDSDLKLRLLAPLDMLP